MSLKLSRRAWMRTIIYSSLALAGGVGYVSSKRLEVVRADVPLARLPAELHGVKIGIMADFHAGAFITREQALQAVRTINNEKPDLIALLGDYVDGTFDHGSRNDMRGAFIFSILKELHAPMGIYAVLGNHDHLIDARQVKEKLNMLPIDVLNNQSRILENGLAVAGVDDYWTGPANSIRALRNLKPQSVTIMLSHNPDVNLQLKGDEQVGLVLSGHTHGGQIRVPLINRALWVPCSKKYRNSTGLIRETEQRWTFITKGVGTFLVPIRLACPPDVGVVRLVKA